MKMELDCTLTPEQQWDEVKARIFKGEVPQKMDQIIQEGFKESTSESEKWEKLAISLQMIKQRFS